MSKFITFDLAGSEFALPFGVVQSVYTLPTAATRQDEATVPVVDLRKLLRLSVQHSNQRAHILSLLNEQDNLYVLVDQVFAVKRLDQLNLPSIMKTLDTPYVGFCIEANKIIPIIQVSWIQQQATREFKTTIQHVS